jgi:hypothetical protein
MKAENPLATISVALKGGATEIVAKGVAEWGITRHFPRPRQDFDLE